MKLTLKPKLRTSLKLNTASRRTFKTSKKSKITEKLELVSLAVLNNVQIRQLSKITGNKNIMKLIGMGRIWTISDIYQYIKDEKKELNKINEKDKQYYSFVLIRNNIPIGFISGRKNNLLNAPIEKKYNILLRMFIDTNYTGYGYGTLLLEMFIKKYIKLLKKDILSASRDVELVSDIEPSNIASIKIHTKNNFTFSKDITYKGNKHLHRYIRIINI